MGRTRRAVICGAVGALVTAGMAAGTALADPDPEPLPELHNITYRARVDGLARGALVSYRISDAQVNSAAPTMLPGRLFETTGVLSDPKEAGMRISIQWPYSANLSCEILVDDQTVAAASQFISPRLTPARDDPDYGALNCGAPLSNATGTPITDLPVAPDLPADVSADVPADQITAPLPVTAVDPDAPRLN